MASEEEERRKLVSKAHRSLTEGHDGHNERIPIEERGGGSRHVTTAFQQQQFLLLGQLPRSASWLGRHGERQR